MLLSRFVKGNLLETDVKSIPHHSIKVLEVQSPDVVLKNMEKCNTQLCGQDKLWIVMSHEGHGFSEDSIHTSLHPASRPFTSALPVP